MSIQQTTRLAEPSQNGHGPSEVLDRVPPSDPATEKALVGCAMLDAATVLEHVRPNDLYSEPHQIIVRAMQALQAAGVKPEPLALGAKLREQGKLETVGGVAYLLDLAQAVPHAASWRYYLDQIVDLSRRRQLLRHGERSIQTAFGTEPLDEALAEASEAISAICRVDSREPRFKLLTSHQLDSGDYALTYAINGVLVIGQPCIIAGPHKSLKTSIMLDMAIALAIGRLFLGYFHVNRQFRTLVMSGESGLGTLQETARRICGAAGVYLCDLENLLWSSDLPKFGEPADVVALGEMLKENAVEVLIVDPLYLSMPGGDAGNLFIMGEMLRAVSAVCEQLGITLVLLHHVKKGVVDPYAPPELSDIAWAGCPEFARQWFLIGRREKYEPGTGTQRLWFNVGGSAGHGGAWALDIEEATHESEGGRKWEVEVLPAAEARAEATERTTEAKAQRKAEQVAATLDSDVRKLLKAMQTTPQGETKNKIRARVHMSGARLDVVLETAVERKLVELCDIPGTKNRTYQGFKLATTGQVGQLGLIEPDEQSV